MYYLRDRRILLDIDKDIIKHMFNSIWKRIYLSRGTGKLFNRKNWLGTFVFKRAPYGDFFFDDINPKDIVRVDKIIMNLIGGFGWLDSIPEGCVQQPPNRESQMIYSYCHNNPCLDPHLMRELAPVERTQYREPSDNSIRSMNSQDVQITYNTLLMEAGEVDNRLDFPPGYARMSPLQASLYRGTTAT